MPPLNPIIVDNKLKRLITLDDTIQEEEKKSLLIDIAQYGNQEQLESLFTRKEFKITQEEISLMLEKAAEKLTSKTENNWRIHCFADLQTENKPSKKAMSTTLACAAKEKNWSLVIHLYSMNGNNAPDKESRIYALTRLVLAGQTEKLDSLFSQKELQPNQEELDAMLEVAVSSKSVGMLEYLINLQTGHKPSKEAMNTALKNAADRRFWVGVNKLCMITENNAPDEESRIYALTRLAWLAGYEPLKLLFSSKEFQPSQKEINTILDQASFANSVDKIRLIINLQTDNKPDRSTIEKVLKRMVYYIRDESSIAELSTLSGDNAPSVEFLTKLRHKAQGIRNATLQKNIVDILDNALKTRIPTKESQNSSPEQEAQRVQQEQEAQRVQQEQEAQRVRQEQEAQRVQQEQEAQRVRQEFNSVHKKITGVLETLETKIKGITQHHLEGAKTRADDLLRELSRACAYYFHQIGDPKINRVDANNALKAKCEELIKEARPVLERDLDWGDFLTNLFKAIANALILVGSLGLASENAFFKPVRSDPEKAFDEAHSNLFKPEA